MKHSHNLYGFMRKYQMPLIDVLKINHNSYNEIQFYNNLNKLKNELDRKYYDNRRNKRNK